MLNPPRPTTYHPSQRTNYPPPHTLCSHGAYLLVGLDEPGHDLVVNVLVDDEAAETGATLSGGADGGEKHRRNHHVQVRVRHHDQSVVPAQLEQGLAESRLHLDAHLE